MALVRSTSSIIILLLMITLITNALKYNYGNRCEGLDDLSSEIDCDYNPDDFLDVPQIIARHGYPVETHTVTTSDGYLLGLQRIPGSSNGTKGMQPVLLQHGLSGSSADWVINGNNSLAFSLADKGYDVWLGNDRGNTYSRGHISLPIWTSQYWNFSWHEMGTKDLPVVIHHIKNITGKSDDLIYIGHSMGTTQFFVLSSTLPEVASDIKLMIALAPTAFLAHIKSPIRYLAPYANDLTWLAKNLGIKELLPNGKFFKYLSYKCEQHSSKQMCENILFLLFSSERNEINVDIIPTILSHDPAGTSVKTAIHYAQEIKNQGNFQYFDYGPEANMVIYGNYTPPLYPVKNIQVPIYLMYAQNDVLASYIDVMRLSKQLKNLVGTYEIPSENFTHIDFIFGKNASQLVYEQIFKILQNVTSN